MKSKLNKELWNKEGRHCTEVAFVLLTQPAQVGFLAFPRFFQRNSNFLFSQRFIDSSALLSVCGQCMKSCLIVDGTHLVLASGKLVLQKRIMEPGSSCKL